MIPLPVWAGRRDAPCCP